jgi:uncharacterized membrane protein YhaH (DUF805 family)
VTDILLVTIIINNIGSDMTFTQSITTCFSKYATFSGRASRSEFWWFYLFSLLLQWGATIVGAILFIGGSGSDMAIGADLLGGIVSLVLLMPSLTVSARRLHDIGRSGWWLLIAFTIIGIFVLLYWLSKAGETFENNYGPPQLHYYL